MKLNEAEMRMAYQIEATSQSAAPRKSIFQDITQVIVIKQTIEHDF